MMCEHHACRCKAAEYRMRQSEAAALRGDFNEAGRLAHEALQCHEEMVVCREEPQEKET